MTKAEIIEYLYDNNVRADITIEQMAEDLADRKTEPTISKMEQVDKDINVRSKDEPQTETSTNNSTISEKLQLKCDLCRREGDDICIDCERTSRAERSRRDDNTQRTAAIK